MSVGTVKKSNKKINIFINTDKKYFYFYFDNIILIIYFIIIKLLKLKKKDIIDYVEDMIDYI